MDRPFKNASPMKAIIASALFLSSMPVNAETKATTLGDYLTSMDRTEVTFSGRIGYSNSKFTFYDENEDGFYATIDAGRDVRERIETECKSSSFIISLAKLCLISGSGSIEIRGSQIYLSIEKVEQLNK